MIITTTSMATVMAMMAAILTTITTMSAAPLRSRLVWKTILPAGWVFCRGHSFRVSGMKASFRRKSRF